MKRLVSCFYNALRDLIRHDGIEFAGYLSFLTILSLFPALILLVMLLGFVFKLSNNNNVVQQLAQLLFDDTGISEIMVTLQPRIEEIIHSPPQNILEVAVIGMLWTASSTIQGWHVILNRAYRIKSAHSYVTRRLTSIAQFLFMVFLIAFAALIISMLNIFAYKSSSIAMQEAIQDNLSIQYILITFIILMSILWVHVVIPDKKQTIKEVLPGAVLTVFLLLFLAKGFKIYTKRFSQLGAIYGSLEGTIIALLFFYAVNLCIIYGAEANYNLYCRHKDNQT